VESAAAISDDGCYTRLGACGKRGLVAGYSLSAATSELSWRVRTSRGNSIILGIENRDLITVVAFVVKHELVSVIAMGASCHFDANGRTATPAAAILGGF